MLVFIRVVNYFKNNLKNILFLWNVTLYLYQQLRNMEFIKTTSEKAFELLQEKRRVIMATKGDGLFKVETININNNTFFMTSRKGHSLQQNCEDYNFYIKVPKYSKTIY